MGSNPLWLLFPILCDWRTGLTSLPGCTSLGAVAADLPRTPLSAAHWHPHSGCPDRGPSFLGTAAKGDPTLHRPGAWRRWSEAVQMITRIYTSTFHTLIRFGSVIQIWAPRRRTPSGWRPAGINQAVPWKYSVDREGCCDSWLDALLRKSSVWCCHLLPAKISLCHLAVDAFSISLNCTAYHFVSRDKLQLNIKSDCNLKIDTILLLPHFMGQQKSVSPPFFKKIKSIR